MGLGEGFDAEMLKHIAEAGGGRFHSVSEPGQLPAVMRREVTDVVTAS